jgi:hypothetical protein
MIPNDEQFPEAGQHAPATSALVCELLAAKIKELETKPNRTDDETVKLSLLKESFRLSCGEQI